MSFIIHHFWRRIITKGDDRIKRFLCFVVVFIIIFAIPVNATVGTDTKTFSWFCVHRKDHLQPLSDPSFSFIEKYDGYYIDKKHGDESRDKVVYLTFDVGYENGNVSKTLDILKEESTTAAFFILGNVLESHTSLAVRMFNEGHLVCNHTYSHKPMVKQSEESFSEELLKLENTCIALTGRKLSKFYRPPEGRFDEESLIFAQKMGYKTVFWSFAYADWDNNKQMSKEKARNKILDNVHNGEIMLLHPTSSTNAEILQEIIQELKRQGYRFGSLDEL